jgi:hypothetical protein
MRTGAPELRSPCTGRGMWRGRRLWPGRLGVTGGGCMGTGVGRGTCRVWWMAAWLTVDVRRRWGSGAAAFSLATTLQRAMVGPGGPCKARPTRRRWRVARWKEWGSARGAHRRGGLATATTPDSSLPVADFTGEVDTRQCRFAMKVAAWFTLARAAWSRRSKRGSRGGFPIKAERDEEGKRGRFGRAMWRRRRWGAQRCTCSSRGGASTAHA